LPNLLDLSALGFSSLRVEENDLVLGATVCLQDIVDTPEAWTHSADLLPLACRAAIPSRTLRSMATIGGEAVHDDGDSELVAALLALNAIFVVAHPREEVESPAMRFLRRPLDDLSGGGLLRAVVIPGTPHGAALERAALLPSSRSLVSVAVAVTLADSRCIRARIALTGLEGPPMRATEAEALLERTGGPDDTIEAAVDLVAERRPFRSDPHASSDMRRSLARQLADRALRSALLGARSGARSTPPRPRKLATVRSPGALAYFTSGRIELTVDGRQTKMDVDAGTTLLDALRDEGLHATREGCSAGECGACTVLIDGRPALACLTPAVRAQGRTVHTAESAAPHDPVMAHLLAATEGGCGFCVPGIVSSARGLLLSCPEPASSEVREALGGHLCRCLGTERMARALEEQTSTRQAPW
jgi:carbon-monoxide dehydrogenase small subunit